MAFAQGALTHEAYQVASASRLVPRRADGPAHSLPAATARAPTPPHLLPMPTGCYADAAD